MGSAYGQMHTFGAIETTRMKASAFFSKVCIIAVNCTKHCRHHQYFNEMYSLFILEEMCILKTLFDIKSTKHSNFYVDQSAFSLVVVFKNC